MSCERDPLDVYSLAETGEADPHIAECVDCRCQLAERTRLLAALPRSMATLAADEDDAWQARVWAQIAAQRAGAEPVAVVQAMGGARMRRANMRRSWLTHGAMASVAAVVLVFALWTRIDASRTAQDSEPGAAIRPQLAVRVAPPDDAVIDERPRVEIIQGPQAGRTSLQVGDSIRVLARKGDRIWIYREEQPVLRCWGSSGGIGCAADPAGSRAELMLKLAGEYQVAVIAMPELTELASPASFTVELANVVRQGGTYRSYDFSVH